MPTNRRWLPIEPLTTILIERGYIDGDYTLNSLLTEGQRQAYYRGVRLGTISDYHADNIAILLKLHPSEIWSNWAELIGG